MKIEKAFHGSSFRTVGFGSATKEEDVLIYGDGNVLNPIAPVVTEFIERTKELRILGNSKLITRHDQRALVSSDQHVCHLLFYPTIHHMLLLELPSFISSVWDSGSFSDTDELIQAAAENYRASNPQPLQCSIIDYQIAKYDDIALNALIHTLAESTFVPLSVLASNLSYSFRFMVSECLYRTSSGHCAPMTAWKDIIEYLQARTDLSPDVLGFLTTTAEHAQSTLSERRVQRVAKEYFDIRDNMIESISQKSLEVNDENMG